MSVPVDTQADDSSAIYTLHGVRVTSATLPKGIYIKGGKKFVKK